VDTEAQQSGPEEEEDEAPSTTIEASGGAGDAIAASDLPVVRRAIVEEINQRRQEIDDAPAISDDGTLANRLHGIAQDHTDAMHTAGRVGIDVEGATLADDLGESCKVQIEDRRFPYTDEEVVVVDSIETTGFTPSDLARSLVDDWLDRERVRALILADDAGSIGFGVALRGATLLVTVIFC
jgi:hypothetical protein